MAKLREVKKENKHQPGSFKLRATSALGISLIADLLDYIAAPVFDMPVIGDIFDVITTSLLFRITGSKLATGINTIEFIPFIGDLIPIYTISTLIWIIRELRKEEEEENKVVGIGNRSISNRIMKIAYDRDR
jgi:hypothetical protein